MAKRRLEVPQIGINGVSEDYVNEFGSIPSLVEDYERGIDLFSTTKRVRKYRERFPSLEYKDVVHD